ncbi:hypothetical protein ACFIOY_05835 [Bradyrhizobium sp. TZ2]
MPLAACIVVAALVLQSSYGGGVVARWAPQLVSTPSLPPENPPLPAQPAPSTVQATAAEEAPPQATPPQATPLAQTAPQDAAPTATAALPDHTQLLQTIVRDLANVERSIEQLKANQQQIASDNSKAIAELKASQEEIKRELTRVSEQSPPKTSPPSDAAGSDLAQARADAAGEGAASILKGVDLRRLVAVDSVITRQQRLDAIQCTVGCAMSSLFAALGGPDVPEKSRIPSSRSAAQKNAAPSSHFSRLCASSSHLPISASGSSL